MSRETPSPGATDAAPPAAAADGLRGTWRLFRVLARKRAILLVRYPVDTLGGLVATFVFFLLLFAGGRTVGGTSFDDSLGGLIVGYFVVTTAIAGYQSLARTVTEEAQWGTLERLYMSPLGFGRVMLLQAVVNVIFSFLWGGVLLPPMLLVTGERLQIDLLTIVPLVVLALLSVMGVGFVFAGAAVVYKRVSNVFNLLQFAFVGLVAAPLGEYPWLRFLPLAWGNALLGRAMRDGVRLWEFPLADLGLLVVVAVGYFVGGYLLFRLFVRRARRLGVLGHY